MHDSLLYNDSVILRFDERKHSYTVIQYGEEFVVPSVTTILKVISKGDALVQWAANQVVACVKEKISVEEVYSGELVHEVADDCKYAFRRKKQEAADIGTEAHRVIEGILSEAVWGQFNSTKVLESLEAERREEGTTSGAVSACVLAAAKWLDSSGFTPTLVERRVYSSHRKFSGTADVIGTIGSEVWLADWKSSKAIYPEYFLQTAAYCKAYIEEHPGTKFAGRFLVRLGKEDGAFEIVERVGQKLLNQDYKAFLAAKQLYDWQQENKS